jgi:hypothetical protein
MLKLEIWSDLIHSEEDTLGGELEERADELGHQVNLQDQLFAALSPHDGVTQQPLFHKPRPAKSNTFQRQGHKQWPLKTNTFQRQGHKQWPSKLNISMSRSQTVACKIKHISKSRMAPSNKTN